jgi:hypothetical protein
MTGGTPRVHDGVFFGPASLLRTLRLRPVREKSTSDPTGRDRVKILDGERGRYESNGVS